ncbi:unnamed protein product [Penicillium salamii]|nr:unnamed protein product [Penicillium salamii]
MVLHGLDAFRTLLLTRLATQVSLRDFETAMCAKQCHFCGQFGEYVFVFTWKRCCAKCLMTSPETQVRTQASIRKQFHTTQAELRQITSFKSLPGLYYGDSAFLSRRLTLLSLHEAESVFERKPLTIRYRTISTKVLNSMGARPLPFYNKKTKQVEHVFKCLGCQRAYNYGAHPEMEQHAKKIYLREELLDHFRWCGDAQKIWRLKHGA